MNEPLFDEKTIYANPSEKAASPLRRSGRKSKSLPVGELIVDGLLQGMAAGIVMLLAFLALGLLDGHGVGQILSALGLAGGATPMQGVLVHLAISATYGVLWSILVIFPFHLYLPVTTAFPWEIAGACFGCITWLIAEVCLLALTGLSLLPWFELLIAHLLYGGTLGLIAARQATQGAH